MLRCWLPPFRLLRPSLSSLPPLLLLPSRQAKAPDAQALLKQLTAEHSFYTTPAGSNDDWCALGHAGQVWSQGS